MAITPDSTAEASDFINQSEADPTPANDAGRVPKLESDGKLSGHFLRRPIVRVYESPNTPQGSSTTRFDITNPSGTTFRYTYDGTGTDPNISAANYPVGTIIYIYSPNFNSGNNGSFKVTGSGANYFEVTNASGVAENDKTIGNGHFYKEIATWTKPANLTYISVELVGAGGGGEGGGISRTWGGRGGGTCFGDHLYASGGYANTAGNGVGGDFNAYGARTDEREGGDLGEQVGGMSFFSGSGQKGSGGKGGDNSASGSGYADGAGAAAGGYSRKFIDATELDSTVGYCVGAGGAGGGSSSGGSSGDSGGNGVIIITEYYT